MGQKLTWRTDQSVVKDSINEYPIDSVCLHKAVHLTNGLQNFISNFASLGKHPVKYTKVVALLCYWHLFVGFFKENLSEFEIIYLSLAIKILGVMNKEISEWFEELPDQCPPEDAMECNGVYFRIANGNPATSEDFFSQRK